jgi:hypothetical protein
LEFADFKIIVREFIAILAVFYDGCLNGTKTIGMGEFWNVLRFLARVGRRVFCGSCEIFAGF